MAEEGAYAEPANTDSAECRARLASACNLAELYLVTRQTPNGGFCSYRSQYVEDENLADTACAIHAFTLLGCPVPEPERVLQFLSGFADCRQPVHLLNLIDTWQRLRPDDSVGAQVSSHIEGLALTPLPAPDVQQTGWLARTRTVAYLKQWAGDNQTVARAGELVRSLAYHGAFGATPNLWDTWLALDILSLSESVRVFDEQSRSFVDTLQCLPAGFTLTPRSRVATLGTVFAGFNCCRLLDMPVRYPEHALRFVLGCQTQRGGFAPSPGALADVEMTDRALSVLLSPLSHAGGTPAVHQNSLNAKLLNPRQVNERIKKRGS